MSSSLLLSPFRLFAGSVKSIRFLVVGSFESFLAEERRNMNASML